MADADRERARETLEAALADPAQAPKHARIRAALAQFGKPPEGAPLEIAAGKQASPSPSASSGRDQPPADDDNGVIPRVGRGLARMGRWINDVPAMAINEGMDSLSFGAYRKGADALANYTGVRVGPTPEMYQKLETEHPIVAAAGRFGGDVVPIGGPAKVGRAVGGAVDRAVLDPLLSTLARSGAGAAARTAARTGAGALAGAGATAGVAGLRKMVEGGGGLGTVPDAVKAALEAAPSGAAVGAGLSGLGAIGGEVARKIRGGNQDIQALERAGLEPSPIPGRPVVRADQPLTKQLPGMSEPPLGVSRATPATRGMVAREAADEIVPDITARKKASNKRFGEMQGEAYAKQGGNPADFEAIVADIDRRLANQSLPDATRKALGDVRSRFEPYMETAADPELAAMRAQMAGASPAQRARLQKIIAEQQADQPPMKPFTARDLDEIRDYADSKVKTGEIKKGDVQFMQLSELMRGELGKAGPDIAKLNTMQSEVSKGRAKRMALLGMKRDQRGEGEDVYEAVARRTRERGEETATSGARTGKEGHAIERVGRMGPPLSLPGTKGLPDDPGYQSLLDIPRLQLAQENLQATPSKMFSGGGRTQLAQMLPLRVIYPLARRAGDAPLASGKTVAVDDLIGALRRRRRKQGAEMRSRGATD